MKGEVLISCDRLPDLLVETIHEDNLESLRSWKNQYRTSFFFQDIISSSGQLEWYRAYLERPEDFMFVVKTKGITVGCMGFRYISGPFRTIDIYNVIRGVSEKGDKGLMGEGLRIMCSYARKNYPCPQTAKVLRGNPALRWYEQNGFRVSEEGEDYYLLELDEQKYAFHEALNITSRQSL